MKHLSCTVAMAALLLPRPAAHAEAFTPGEQTTFAVDYSGLPAGKASITVGAATKQGTVDVWPVVTLADTAALFGLFPLHDKMVTWWDFERGGSLGWDFYANEARHSRRERARLDVPAAGKATVQRASDEAPSELTIVDHAPGAQDISAAVLALRRQKLEPGTDVTIPVFTGRNSWDLTAHVHPPVPLDVKAGHFEALPLDVVVHFEGKLQSKRALKLWVSHDEHHALLKIEAELALGSLNAEAVSYQPGAPLTPNAP